MRKMILVCCIIVLYFFITNVSIAQSLEKGYGIGIAFGTTAGRTDVGGFSPQPISRIFGRFQPLKNFAIEMGFGFGMLEGNKFGFFSSKIIPLDLRFLFYTLNYGRLQPIFFTGFSFMNFNPVDQQERKLPNNAKRVYSNWMGTLPMGVNLAYSITRSSIIELTCSYSLGTKDYLDDIKANKNNDGFFFTGINIYAFFESEDTDPDGDGLTTREEKELGTDPSNPDTDGDRLRDGYEVHIYRTNPLKKDTDDDGLSDYDETLISNTNPLLADTDGDGLMDGEEVMNYHTDPLNPDTDSDGLTDGDEVLKYRTNPLNKDTDGDGLSDGAEVLIHKTDPLNFDTDNGGVPDGKEVERGTNPLDQRDDYPIIQVGEKIVLIGITFEIGKATLSASSIDTLNIVVNGLMANPEVEVEISGHTDNVGSAKFNEKLSLMRAEAVKQFLVGKGVSSNRITVKGYGFQKPVAPNDTEEGRAMNRRIEFLRTK